MRALPHDDRKRYVETLQEYRRMALGGETDEHGRAVQPLIDGAASGVCGMVQMALVVLVAPRLAATGAALASPVAPVLPWRMSERGRVRGGRGDANPALSLGRPIHGATPAPGERLLFKRRSAFVRGSAPHPWARVPRGFEGPRRRAPGRGRRMSQPTVRPASLPDTRH